MTPDEAFARRLSLIEPLQAGATIGVAVSGGSDSMALLVLTIDYALQQNVTVKVATVDHGLRPEAAQEAAEVSAFCARQNIEHKTLHWLEWDQQGNLQSAARQARYALLSDWAKDIAAEHVLLGHTEDDQAETVLLALSRGSGVDGLAGMSVQKGNLFLRPLLDVTRDDLRKVLIEKGVTWVDDPSNADDRYDRVKARQILQNLKQLGLTQGRLVQTANHMSRARKSLQATAQSYARTHVRQQGPDLILPAEVLDLADKDVHPRVFSAAIMWVSGATYRPRFAALCDVAEAVAAGHARTLHGTFMSLENGNLRVTREFAACRDNIVRKTQDREQIWDGRWVISHAQEKGEWPKNLTIKALGQAVSQVKNWRDAGLPYASVQATPGIFKGEMLISAPGVGYLQGFSTRLVADFHTSPLFH